MLIYSFNKIPGSVKSHRMMQNEAFCVNLLLANKQEYLGAVNTLLT